MSGPTPAPCDPGRKRAACADASVAVVADVDRSNLIDSAAALADSLGLPLLASAARTTTPELTPGSPNQRGTSCQRTKPDFHLVVCVDRLELREQTTGDRRAGARAGGRPILVDFIGGSTGYRRHARLSRRQPIALAMGRRHGPLQVVDATAGLGRDAFLLACMGLSVHMVERNAVLAALLGDGLRRAQAATDPNLAAIIKRMKLSTGDARDLLSSIGRAAGPDVVHVDTMYPMHTKSALAKKEMRVCRRLAGDDNDAAELLEVARAVAKRRVIVKRPRHASPLAPRPSLRYVGKQVRYDVYLTA